MVRQVTQYDPVFGYRFIPSLRARIPHESGGFLLRTNLQGFRSERDFEARATAGQQRLLIFGDSYTAGDGVANAQRWSDRLEAKLSDLQTYNFGLPGSGTDQQYLVWRECAGGIEHVAVLLAVFVENIRRIAARYRTYFDDEGRRVIYAKPYFLLNEGKLELHHVPPPPRHWQEQDFPADAADLVDRGGRFVALREFADKLGAKEVLQKLTRYQPVPDYDEPQGPAWQLMRAILGQWVRAIDRPVLLMPIPMHQHVEQTSDARPYQQRFAELAADLGCALHDPLADLQAYPSAQRRRFRFEADPHPTPAGHEALAESLAPAVRALLQHQPQAAQSAP